MKDVDRSRASAAGAAGAGRRRDARRPARPSRARPAAAQMARPSSPVPRPRSPKYWTPRSADSAAPWGSTGLSAAKKPSSSGRGTAPPELVLPNAMNNPMSTIDGSGPASAANP